MFSRRLTEINDVFCRDEQYRRRKTENSALLVKEGMSKSKENKITKWRS